MENEINDIYDPNFVYDHTGAENLKILSISKTYDVNFEYEFIPFEYE